MQILSHALDSLSSRRPTVGNLQISFHYLLDNGPDARSDDPYFLNGNLILFNNF